MRTPVSCCRCASQAGMPVALFKEPVELEGLLPKRSRHFTSTKDRVCDPKLALLFSSLSSSCIPILFLYFSLRPHSLKSSSTLFTTPVQWLEDPRSHRPVFVCPSMPCCATPHRPFVLSRPSIHQSIHPPRQSESHALDQPCHIFRRLHAVAHMPGTRPSTGYPFSWQPLMSTSSSSRWIAGCSSTR